jgi:hypothetical protein
MSLARVHAVMAAGVEQPRLLARWRRQPARLRALGVDPAEIDLDALAKFAGLGVKVRHNPLRGWFPLSFRLMHVAALEVDAFAAYAAHRSEHGLGYAAAMPERARDLVAFLDRWLRRRERSHALLRDALHYEEAIAQLGPWHVADAPSAPARSDEAAPAAAPRVRGTLRLLMLGCDPQALAAELRTRAPDPSRVPRERHRLCVWRAPDGDEVAVLPLDAFGFHLLGEIDGRRTPQALARRLGGGRGTTAAVRAALCAFAEAGVVGWSEACAESRSEASTPRCA